jgi:hypothetical protein
VFNDALNYQTSWKTAKWTRWKWDLKMRLGQTYVILNMQQVTTSAMREPKSQRTFLFNVCNRTVLLC